MESSYFCYKCYRQYPTKDSITTHFQQLHKIKITTILSLQDQVSKQTFKYVYGGQVSGWLKIMDYQEAEKILTTHNFLLSKQ